MTDFAFSNFFLKDAGIQKLLWKSLFVALFALSHIPSYALSLQGTGIEDELLVPLDDFESRYILVRAKQSSADYVLAANSPDNNVSSITANFPSGSGLDELLLVDRESCSGCTISIRPFEVIDASSRYHLTIEEFSQSPTLAVEAYQEMTIAAEWRSESRVAVDSDSRNDALEKSVTALAKTAEVAGEINDQELRFHALTLLAEAQYRLGLEDKQKVTLETILDETQARESIYRALAFFEYSPLTGDINSMIDYCRQGMEIGKSLQDLWIEAKGANFTGRFLIGGGWPEQGKTLINRSKNILVELNNWRELSTPLHNLSWAEQRAGNYDVALKYAADQLAHANKYSDEEGVIWALYNFGLAHSENGDLFKAEVAMDDAFKRLKALPFRSNTTISILKGAIAEYKYKGALVFGDYLLASKHLRSTKQLFKDQGWPNLVADASFYEGELALESGRIEEAETLLLEVLEYDNEYHRARNKARVLQKLTRLEIDRLDILKAHEYVVQSIEAARTTSDKKLLTHSLVNAVEVIRLSKAFSEADQLADTILTLVDSYGIEKDKIRYNYQRAQLKASLSDFAAAKSYVQNVQDSIDAVLVKVVRKDQRREYLALQKAVYEFSISLVSGSGPEAILSKLALAERFKARTLAETIGNRSLAIGIEQSYSTRQRGIHDKIIENAIALRSGNGATELILESSRELYSELAKLEANAQNNRVNELNGSNSNNQNRDSDVQSLVEVAENELLAYYFLGKSRSWLWLITKESLYEYELPGENQIANAIEEYKDLVATPPVMRFKSLSEQYKLRDLLSKQLIAPLANKLSKTLISHITIVPDSVLHGLPFSSLHLPGDSQPLVSSVAVSYTPSLDVRQNISKSKMTGVNFGLGPVFAMADPKSLDESEFRFAELPHSLSEVEAMEEILGSKLSTLSGIDASKEAVIEELIKPYQILHFATHGLVNAKEPALSGLIFSSRDNRNSIWIAPEISSSNIEADLIVLSACETAEGKSISGEGLMSLSRAFIEAGANRVIGSGWKVEDHSTSELMKHFYKYLLDDGLTVAASLRSAQQEVMESTQSDWSDPFFWAAFQLLGGQEAI